MRKPILTLPLHPSNNNKSKTKKRKVLRPMRNSWSHPNRSSKPLRRGGLANDTHQATAFGMSLESARALWEVHFGEVGLAIILLLCVFSEWNAPIPIVYSSGRGTS